MVHFDKSIGVAEKWLMLLEILSGNPIAIMAGLKTMDVLARNRQNGGWRALLGKGLKDLRPQTLTQAVIAHPVCGDLTLLISFLPTRNAQAIAVQLDAGLFKSPGRTLSQFCTDRGGIEPKRSGS